MMVFTKDFQISYFIESKRQWRYLGFTFENTVNVVIKRVGLIMILRILFAGHIHVHQNA